MRLRYKGSTLAADVLVWLWKGLTTAPYSETQKRFGSSSQYYKTISSLQKRGAIRVVLKQGVKFIELTQSGELEVLISKAVSARPSRWDGKWRVVMFDIPEDARDKRNQLRTLLKKNGFIKLQASVFINPYPFNREAVQYLQESGLINYIRFLKVEEMDMDADLRKKFHLSTKG